MQYNYFKICLFLLIFVSFAGIAQTNKKKAAQRPNVVIIYSDDQGYADLNIYGSKDLATPNLDKLARKGTRFTQFYAAAPICSPSRASLLTGRYPHRACW
jgi:arylsulfatase A